jgi:hypothetical protein
VYCSRRCRQDAYEARKLALGYPDYLTPTQIIEAKRAKLAVAPAIAVAVREAEEALLKRIAALKPDIREMWLEIIRKEPSQKRLAELRQLVKLQ